MNGLLKRLRGTVPPGLVLSLLLFGMTTGLFELLRLVLYLRNLDLAAGAAAGALARAFLTGLRFDASAAAYAMGVLVLIACLARLVFGVTGERATYVAGATVLGVFFVIACLAEVEFYREFFSRYNMLAIQYWSHPGTVTSMIWHGYPVVRYLLVAVVLVGGWFLAVRFVAGRLFETGNAGQGGRAGWFLVVPVLLLFGIVARGGARGTPLQWGDAVRGDSEFADALAQNGIWSLGRALADTADARRSAGPWERALPRREAHLRARRLVTLPGEEPAGDQDLYPLLRKSRGGGRAMDLRRAGTAPPNVVVILMESFTARYVGALGAPGGRTPEFDRLASEGVLFDRCLSNGSHTDQAVYCVQASFPNLPGHESLMQTMLGDQPFDTLASALRGRGYRTLFLYNGDLAWDNMLGFFRRQGVERFIGRSEFAGTGRFDVTWGGADKDLFERTVAELSAIRGPFCATVLTLSNHTPFDLPRPLPFPEITDEGAFNGRMNGIRFADWSVGRFMDLARRESWFDNTLFVLVGDHGFSIPPILTGLNVLRFHVPLLFYAPGLLGREPRRPHTLVSHLDIAPTILGLLGDDLPRQHWGRDILALPADDPGFAVFKMAGGAPEVGFARGDTLLVRTGAGRRDFYKLNLSLPAPSAETIAAPPGGGADEMDLDLRAYVQTALEVLKARRAAPPGRDSAQDRPAPQR